MIRNRPKLRALSLAASLVTALHGTAFAAEPAPPAALPNRACSLDAPAVAEKDGELKGHRRLALVVGVGEYKNNPRPKSLVGPPNDADRMYRLLTDPVGGFGFPKENVCLLKNSEASLAAFEKAFQDGLVKRAQDGDVVVVYFAGHGSQAKDGNGDEPDQKDETLMLWDARANGVPDLVDDKVNVMLGQLYKKMSGEGGKPREQNVTVILDSCNSGTASRGDENPTAQTRFFETSKDTLDLRSGIPSAAPGGAQWDGEELSGLNFISAAVDGTAAKEIHGEGIFTTALIQVLRDSAGTPLSYDQLQLRLDPLVAARSDQKVQVQGARTDLKVFGASTVGRPAGYLVSNVRLDKSDNTQTNKRTLELKGTPLPGWSVGAQVRLYNLPGTQGPASALSDLKDPAKAKATGVITQMNGVEGATVEIADKETAQNKARLESLRPGDIAVLAFPGKDSVALNVRLTPKGKPGAIAADRARRITDAISGNQDLQQTVRVLSAKDKADEVWTLSQGSDGNLQLFDAFGVLRSGYAFKDPAQEPAKVARNLGQHARQKALLQVKGEEGSDFKNDRTLQVQVVPVKKGLKPECDKAAERWDSAKYPAGSAEVEIPLEVCWQVKVRLADDAPQIPLYVGGVFMSSDGGIEGFPSAARKEQQFITLEPGKTLEYTFKMSKKSAPPLKARDHLLVFGTREPVKWSELTEPAATRGASSGLQGALSAYMGGGSRGADDIEVSEPNTWTSSHVALVTVANSGFKDSLAQEKTDKREFSLPHYDIREQLPGNTQSALYKLLVKTYELANRYEEGKGTDGAHYDQAHIDRWKTNSDEANLDIGIDCSRSIWYAFTRAGLQYNNGMTNNPKVDHAVKKRGSYLSTWDMVDEKSAFLDQIALHGKIGKSAMRAKFDSCKGKALRPGDVLVYRRLKTSAKNDGHVVMVIDPEKNIAWGSHAFDSSAMLSKDKTAQMDVGVEYQQILRTKSGHNEKWGAWDKSDLVRVECWRNKQIAKEWNVGSMNHPGTFDLRKPLNLQVSPAKNVP